MGSDELQVGPMAHKKILRRSVDECRWVYGWCTASIQNEIIGLRETVENPTHNPKKLVLVKTRDPSRARNFRMIGSRGLNFRVFLMCVGQIFDIVTYINY